MHYLQHILILLLLVLMPFASAAQKSKEDDAPAAIQPLLGGRVWGQGAPFNNLCPKFRTYTSTPTGCVATAMAQIMAYHKHPLKGVKDVTYQLPTMNEHLYTFIKNQPYDWDNMLDSYKEETEYTSTQGFAVAILMSHAGVCTYTDYTHETSTAFNTEAVRAMVENFLYDDEIRLIRRSDYPADVWEKLIQEDLRKGKPVYYSGSNPDNKNRHTFVIDGMDTEGRYHINWGWDGTYNGYYHLDALIPVEGSPLDYSHHAHAIVNIHPADSMPEKSPTNMAATPISLTTATNGSRHNEEMTLSIAMLKNLHHLNFSGEIQPYLTDKDGKFHTPIGTPFSTSLPSGNERSNTIELTFNIPDTLPDGTYRLYAGVRQRNHHTWDYIRGQREDDPLKYHYYTISIREGSITTDKTPATTVPTRKESYWGDIRITEDIFLHLTPHIDLKGWQLYSSQGELLNQGEGNHISTSPILINLLPYPTGIYLLRGTGADGRTYVMKFMKR